MTFVSVVSVIGRISIDAEFPTIQNMPYLPRPPLSRPIDCREPGEETVKFPARSKRLRLMVRIHRPPVGIKQPGKPVRLFEAVQASLDREAHAARLSVITGRLPGLARRHPCHARGA